MEDVEADQGRDVEVAARVRVADDAGPGSGDQQRHVGKAVPGSVDDLARGLAVAVAEVDPGQRLLGDGDREGLGGRRDVAVDEQAVNRDHGPVGEDRHLDRVGAGATIREDVVDVAVGP